MKKESAHRWNDVSAAMRHCGDASLRHCVNAPALSFVEGSMRFPQIAHLFKKGVVSEMHWLFNAAFAHCRHSVLPPSLLLFTALHLCTALPCVAADPDTVTKTVKSSGGDYATIAAFESGYAKDLVTANEVVVCEIYDKGSAWDENVVVDDGSWTTSSDCHIIFRAPAEDHHSGDAGTGTVINPSSDGHVFQVDIDFCRFEWLEITGWQGTSAEAFRINGDSVTVRNCILHNADGDDENQDAIYLGTNGITADVENCIIYDIPRCAVHVQDNQNITANVRNVTVYNAKSGSSNNDYCGLGFDVNGTRNNTGSVFNVENTYVDAASGNAFHEGEGGTYGTFDNNVSSDATADDFGGSNNLINKAAGDQFVSTTADAEDLHLESSGDLDEAGKTLTAFSDDIDADTRPIGASWDIGADEASGASGTDDYSTWTYSTNLTLNTTSSGADVTTGDGVRDFPVLVRLNAGNFTFDQLSDQTGGTDLRFAASDGSHLYYEIERCDPSIDSAEIWVRLDTIKVDNNTQYFTMYWGKSGAGDSSSAENVFDSSTGFRGVWHLDEETAGTGTSDVYKDATVNGNDGTDQVSSTDQGGLVGKGHAFDGDDEVSLGDADALDFGTLDFSVGVWIKSQYEAASGVWPSAIMSWGSDETSEGQWNLFFGATEWVPDTLVFQVKVPNDNNSLDTRKINDNTWHYVVGTKNSDSMFVYIDGTEVAADAHGLSGSVSNNDSKKLGYAFTGYLDEARAERTQRSANWIKLCYENQKVSQTLVEFPSSGTGGFSAFSYSQPCSLQTDALNLTDSVFNFPMLIRLTETDNRDVFQNARSDGHDIRFSKSDESTSLYYEMERWDLSGADSVAEFWVLVDTIAHENDVQNIVMHFGNSDSSADRSADSLVFDTANGFVGVWHFPPADTFEDASWNDYDGTNDSSTALTSGSPIGHGREFDSSSGYIDVTGFPDDVIVDEMTISTWVNLNDHGDWREILAKAQNDYTEGSYGIRRSGGDNFVFTIDVTADGKHEISGNGFTDDGSTWYYVAGVLDGSYQRLYQDGSQASSRSETSSIVTTTNNLNFARGADDAGEMMDGRLDEIRISKVGRSADWIKLCYYTQKSDASVVVFGTAAAKDATAPTVSSFSPLDNAVNVPVSSNLVVTFDENVQKGTGNIVIKETSGDATFETIDVTSGQVSISGAEVTINPSGTFAPGTGYYVEIAATCIEDLANNSFSGISDKTTWNFTTVEDIPFLPLSINRGVKTGDYDTCTIYTDDWHVVFDEQYGGGIRTLAVGDPSEGGSDQVESNKNLFYNVVGGSNYSYSGTGTLTLRDSSNVLAVLRQEKTVGTQPFVFDYTVHGSGRIYVRASAYSAAGIGPDTLEFRVANNATGSTANFQQSDTESECDYLLHVDSSANKFDLLLALFEDWAAADDPVTDATAHVGIKDDAWQLAAGEKDVWEFMIDFAYQNRHDTTGLGSHVADYRQYDEIDVLDGTIGMQRAWEHHIRGHWTLDKGQGDTAYDFSADNCNGVVTLDGDGAWTSSGKWGAALDLDGANDNVTVSHRAGFNCENELTIMAWVDPDVNTSGTILSHFNSNQGYKLELEGAGKLKLFLDGGTVTGATAVGTGDGWHHVAATFVNHTDTVKLYLDGVLDKTAGSSVGVTSVSQDLVIGSGYDGKIDDVRLYQEAISEETIKAIMQQGYRSAQGLYMVRADDNNTMQFYLDGGDIGRNQPVFQIANYWAESPPAEVYLGTDKLTRDTHFYVSLDDPNNELFVALDTLLGDSVKFYLDDNDPSGRLLEGAASSITHGGFGATDDSIVVKNFSGSTFGASGSNQWAVVIDRRCSSDPDHGCGGITWYTTSETNASEEWDNGYGSGSLVASSSVLNPVKWRYTSGTLDSCWGGGVRNDDTLAITNVETTSVRTKFELGPVKMGGQGDGGDLAYNQSISASYTFGSYPATNANDNDAGTDWRGNTSGDGPDTITIDWGTSTTFDSIWVDIEDRSDADYDWFLDYYDGSWANITSGTDEDNDFSASFSAVSGTKVRLRYTDYWDRHETYAWEIYNTSASASDDSLSFRRQYTIYPDGKIMTLFMVDTATAIDTIWPGLSLANYDGDTLTPWWDGTGKRAGGYWHAPSDSVHGVGMGFLGYQSLGATGVTSSSLVHDTLKYTLSGSSETDTTFQEGADSYSGTKDAHVIEWVDHSGKNTGGNDENECCRYTGTQDGDEKYVLVSFDVSSIPSTATVSSATLSMYLTRTRNGTTSKTVHAYQILESWDEGSGTGIDGQDVAGVDWSGEGRPSASSTSLDNEAIGSTVGWYSWTITDLVQNWVDGDTSNYGVYLKEEDGNESSGNGTKVFASSEYATQSSRPKLNVVYTSAGGGSAEKKLFFQDTTSSRYEAGDTAYHLALYYDISRDYASGAEIDTVVNAMVHTDQLSFKAGVKDTLDFGDLDSSGFNEAEGCWVVDATNNAAHVGLGISADVPAHPSPVFKITDYRSSYKPQYLFLYTHADAGSPDTVRLQEDYQYTMYHDKANNQLIMQLDTTLRDSAYLYMAVDPTLAVQMSTFNGRPGHRCDTLLWRTESEQENLGFILYRRVKPAFLDSVRAEVDSSAHVDSLEGVPARLYKRRVIHDADTAWVRVNPDRLIPGAEGGTSHGPRDYAVVDLQVVNNVLYEYKLVAVDFNNNHDPYPELVEIMPRLLPPTRFLLRPNFPNPFRRRTTISYQLPTASRVALNIYTAQGRLVRQLVVPDEKHKPGYYRTIWDGTDRYGRGVAAGPYIYRIVTNNGKYRKARVMILTH